jgi:hypothetical protein
MKRAASCRLSACFCWAFTSGTAFSVPPSAPRGATAELCGVHHLARPTAQASRSPTDRSGSGPTRGEEVCLARAAPVTRPARSRDPIPSACSGSLRTISRSCCGDRTAHDLAVTTCRTTRTTPSPPAVGREFAHARPRASMPSQPAYGTMVNGEEPPRTDLNGGQESPSWPAKTRLPDSSSPVAERDDISDGHAQVLRPCAPPLVGSSLAWWSGGQRRCAAPPVPVFEGSSSAQANLHPAGNLDVRGSPPCAASFRPHCCTNCYTTPSPSGVPRI